MPRGRRTRLSRQELRDRGYLTLEELVERLRAEGVHLGSGKPEGLIRYWQRKGLIKRPVLAPREEPPQVPVAYYGSEVVGKIRQLRGGDEAKAMPQYLRDDAIRARLVEYYKGLSPADQLTAKAEILQQRHNLVMKEPKGLEEAMATVAAPLPEPLRSRLEAQIRGSREELLRRLADDEIREIEIVLWAMKKFPPEQITVMNRAQDWSHLSVAAADAVLEELSREWAAFQSGNGDLARRRIHNLISWVPHIRKGLRRDFSLGARSEPVDEATERQRVMNLRKEK